MYTAYIKEVDGIKIILGIDTEKLDPVETQKKIIPFVKASIESKIVLDKFDKINKIGAESETSRKQGKRLYERVAGIKFKNAKDLTENDFTSKELESLKSYDAKINSNNAIIQKIQSELPEAQKNLKAKEKEIMKTKGVFFNIGENEVKIKDSDALQYKEILKTIQGEKKFLKLEGGLIIDNRNKTFYGKISDKWEKLSITKLGEDLDFTVFTPEEDLTIEERKEVDKQFETERIVQLSDIDRQKEIDMLTEGAVQKSINMRGKLDIIGDKKALEKSQAFYQEQVNLINVKYKKVV